MPLYGLTCSECRANIDIEVPEKYDPVLVSRQIHFLAGMEGWCIGHWDGQGEYVCSGCKAAVWDPVCLIVEFYREINVVNFAMTVMALEALGEDRPYERLSPDARHLWTLEQLRRAA